MNNPLQDAKKPPQNTPKMLPRPSQGRPRRPKMVPRYLQDAPGTSQDAQLSPQDAAWNLQDDAKTSPRPPQDAMQTSQGLPRTLQASPDTPKTSQKRLQTPSKPQKIVLEKHRHDHATKPFKLEINSNKPYTKTKLHWFVTWSWPALVLLIHRLPQTHCNPQTLLLNLTSDSQWMRRSPLRGLHNLATNLEKIKIIFQDSCQNIFEKIIHFTI